MSENIENMHKPCDQRQKNVWTKTAPTFKRYQERIINSAIERVRKIPGRTDLKKTEEKIKTRRPFFALRYDPRLPAIPNIQSKHWRSMKNQDTHLGTVFPEPPLPGLKRQKNLREYLIRAKVPNPQNTRPKREIKGLL